MLRNILLAIGILLIIISLTLIAQNDFKVGLDEPETEKRQINRKKEDVIKAAKELGMKFPQKLSKKEIKTQVHRVGLQLETDDKSASQQKQTKIEPVTIQIKPGATADGIVRKLYEAGVIEDKQALSKLIERLGVSNRILAGKYEFKTNTPLEKILLTIIGN